MGSIPAMIFDYVGQLEFSFSCRDIGSCSFCFLVAAECCMCVRLLRHVTET